MSGPATFAAGFEVPLHRSLTEPILLGGAPRTVAIANGTLAAAVGLGPLDPLARHRLGGAVAPRRQRDHLLALHQRRGLREAKQQSLLTPPNIG